MISVVSEIPGSREVRRSVWPHPPHTLPTLPPLPGPLPSPEICSCARGLTVGPSKVMGHYHRALCRCSGPCLTRGTSHGWGVWGPPERGQGGLLTPLASLLPTDLLSEGVPGQGLAHRLGAAKGHGSNRASFQCGLSGDCFVISLPGRAFQPSALQPLERPSRCS